MCLQRAVITVIVASITSSIASPAVLSLAHGGVECGQNPMHAVQLVSQKTGKLGVHNNKYSSLKIKTKQLSE